MPRMDINSFSETAADNTDIGGVPITGSSPARNIDDADRATVAILAKAVNGTTPVNDTWTWRDPTDATKRFQMDGENIPTSTQREIDVEAMYQLLELGGAPRLVTAHTGSGTHTFNASTKYYQIIASGGGGGSGGVSGQGGSTGAATAGGNSGYHARSPFYAKGALTTGTVVIGAGGAAGAGSAGDGGDGGDTTWTDATVGTLTWRGGKGSGGLVGNGSLRYGIPVVNPGSSGALVGSAPPGGAGHSNGTIVAGGIGGSNPWGTGGIPSAQAFNGAVAAVSGSGYGAGASGAASHGVGTNAAGAAGTAGHLEVWEY